MAEFRTGDAVRHRPSGETWVLAWADHRSGTLAALGWPYSTARIADCEIVRRASETERTDLIARMEVNHHPAAATARRLMERREA